jgi:serine/threonine-protein kinase mTOR
MSRAAWLPEAAVRSLDDLKSKVENVQTRGATSLKHVVEGQAHELSSERFGEFIKELNRRIYELVKSDEPQERLGGIYAMDALVDVDCDESSLQVRFSNYLRGLLPCPRGEGDVRTMILAARVLGRLARAGGTQAAELVEFEAKRALEGLAFDKKNENQRLASALVLRELAAHAPTLFFMHVPAFLRAIWAGIRDPRQVTREASIEALRACLDLVARRDSPARNRWWGDVYEEARRGLQQGGLDAAHGSLLALGELLRQARARLPAAAAAAAASRAIPASEWAGCGHLGARSCVGIAAHSRPEPLIYGACGVLQQPWAGH